MTYAKAKLIIWNDRAYTPAQVREAAIWILGCMTARREDLNQACLLL